MKGAFRSVLSPIDKTTILSILLISAIVNLLMLVIPVTIQIIVNIVAFGKMFRPVATLGLIVLVLMIGIAFLNIWQSIIIETIRQKCIVNVSFDLTDLFTHSVFNNNLPEYQPDIPNRFFEIYPINKALASILINGTNLSLQTIFGLILLAIYHPLFLWFDAFILISLALIILWPYKLAIKHAMEECVQKHRIAAWLEEVFCHNRLFNFLSYQRFAKKQTDKRLFSFLKTRNLEFRQLIKHQVGLYSLAAVSMSLLLCLGGYLVIQNQLSLGQLVAAEIVFSVIIYSFKDIFYLLENYYELRASLNKISVMSALHADKTYDKSSEEFFIKIHTLQFQFDKAPVATVSKNKPLVIHLLKREDSFSLTKQLLGFSPLTNLSVTINHMSCNTAFLQAIRQYSLLINETQWFMGTVQENLLLNHKQLSSELIYQCLDAFNLQQKIMQLPKGLDTPLNEISDLLTLTDIAKIVMARAYLAKPKILIIDCILDIFERSESELLLDVLLSELKDSLVIILTLQEQFQQLPNRLVLTP
ncbi:MAG: ABC transporter ATP-binding protein [Legionella sp.]|nr:ABC transporter ATP-binding protein [Legionella sp.]